jgi:hypothetical protein
MTPILLYGYGQMPKGNDEKTNKICDETVLRILGNRVFGVRNYGIYSDIPVEQSKRYIPSVEMTAAELLVKIKNGTAYENGNYWAMDDGAGDAAQQRVFQQNLREMIHWRNNISANNIKIQKLISIDDEDNKMSIWWGPPNHTEQLHYDGYSNIHFQLRGSKVWTLYPPNAPLSPNLFVRLGSFGDNNFSKLTKREVDHVCQKVGIKPLVLRVCPGEAIYVPRGWWHTVKGEGDVEWICSINMFEKDVPIIETYLNWTFNWHMMRLRIGCWLDDIHERCCSSIPSIDLPPARKKKELEKKKYE